MAGSTKQLQAVFQTSGVTLTGGGFIYNVKNYGATGDGATNDTTALQAAINAAHATGGSIYLPAGVYSTGKLTFYGNVGIIGEGPRISTLKSRTAEPLLECVYTANVFVFPAVLHGFTLDGNSTGTIGMNLKGFDQFNWYDVEIHHFTSKGMNLLGFLIGKITKFVIYNCPILVDSVFTSFTSDGGMQSNLVCFDNCTFQYGSTWGIQWSQAAGLKLRDCDFEHNGTALNYSTGSVNFVSASPNSEGVGLIVDGCWFEQNQGVCVQVASPFGATRTVIQNTLIQFFQSNTIGVRVYSGGILNKCFISGSTISGNQTDIIADGAGASITHIASTFSTTSAINSGTITNLG